MRRGLKRVVALVSSVLASLTAAHVLEQSRIIERRNESLKEIKDDVLVFEDQWFNKMNIFKHLEDVNAPVVSFLEKKDEATVIALGESILTYNSSDVISAEKYKNLLNDYQRYQVIMSTLELLAWNAYEYVLTREEEDSAIRILLNALDEEEVTFDDRKFIANVAL